jgi:hypothetical protein
MLNSSPQDLKILHDLNSSVKIRFINIFTSSYLNNGNKLPLEATNHSVPKCSVVEQCKIIL